MRKMGLQGKAEVIPRDAQGRVDFVAVDRTLERLAEGVTPGRLSAPFTRSRAELLREYALLEVHGSTVGTQALSPAAEHRGATLLAPTQPAPVSGAEFVELDDRTGPITVPPSAPEHDGIETAESKPESVFAQTEDSSSNTLERQDDSSGLPQEQSPEAVSGWSLDEAPKLDFGGEQTAFLTPAWLSAFDDDGVEPTPVSNQPAVPHDDALSLDLQSERQTVETDSVVEKSALLDDSALPGALGDVAVAPERRNAGRSEPPPLSLDLAPFGDNDALALPKEPLPQVPSEPREAPRTWPMSLPPLPLSSPPPLPSHRPFRTSTQRMPSLRVPPAMPSRRSSGTSTPVVTDDEAIELDLNEVEELGPPPLPGPKK